MSPTIFIMCIWFLESSLGKNLKHPDGSHGHTGINDITLRDINENSKRKGRRIFTVKDLDDKANCFEATRFHLSDYKLSQENWDLKDYFLFWRCGLSGMKTPTEKQKEYALHGVECYKQLMNGGVYWKLK